MDNPILNLLDELRKNAPHECFIETADYEYSRQSFWNASRSVAAILREEMKQAGNDIVAIHEFEPRYFYVYLVAIWMAGYRVLPLNIRMPAHIIESSIHMAKCDLVIGNKAEKPSDIDCNYLCIDRIDEDFETPIEAEYPEGAIIMLTSGSTGQPKAIPLTYFQILENALLTQQRVGLTHEDKLLITMPPCFITGIGHFMSCVVSGARLVSVVGFNFGEQILKLIDEHGITAFGGSPTNVRRILGAAGDRGLGNLRLWISSGDHLAREEQQYFLDRFPEVHFIYMYGLSEVGGRLCVNDVTANPEKLGSPGMPLPGMTVTARSTEDRSVLPPGEPGELTISGPLLMSGYLQSSGDIDRAVVEDGFSTGDLGFVDAEGFVWIQGRTNDVIKVGGEKVSITNVEDALRQSMECSDCAVAIIDDPNLGKVLIGLVVPEPRAAGVENAALMKRLRTILPPNALPAKVFAIEAVPRTGSGKVSRKDARELALELLYGK